MTPPSAESLQLLAIQLTELQNHVEKWFGKQALQKYSGLIWTPQERKLLLLYSHYLQRNFPNLPFPLPSPLQPPLQTIHDDSFPKSCSHLTTSNKQHLYFYEAFLAASQSAARKQRGVYYTPTPVAQYIVRSIHQTLIESFQLPNGLASTASWATVKKNCPHLHIPKHIDPQSPFVQIVDPAVGSGVFLIECLQLIHQTLMARWHSYAVPEQKQRWKDYVEHHLLNRLHGYDIMGAAVISCKLHLTIALWQTGYRGPKPSFSIHQHNPLQNPNLPHPGQLTVVLGNPPYAESSQNRFPFIDKLMLRYKEKIRREERQLKSLSNDWIKFFCLAQHIITTSGSGIIALLTPNSHLDGLLFRDMRKSWIASSHHIFLTDLRGNHRRRDQGIEDENIFPILQGTAVSQLIFLPHSPRKIRFAGLSGSRQSKYAQLHDNHALNLCQQKIEPHAPHYLLLPHQATRPAKGFALPDIFGTGNPSTDRNYCWGGGCKSRQDRFTVALQETSLQTRIKQLAHLSETEMRTQYRLCRTQHFDFHKAQQEARSGHLHANIRHIHYRPFDKRPVIWSRSVFCEPQAALSGHLWHPNLCLLCSRVVKDDAFRHVDLCTEPADVIALSTSSSTNAYMFPLYRYEHGKQVTNLSPQFLDMLAKQLATTVQEIKPEDVFAYLFAVLHSTNYRNRYAQQLKLGFPNIPLPTSTGQFLGLVTVGQKLIDLRLLRNLTPTMTTTFQQSSTIQRGFPKHQQQRIYINTNDYFQPVSSEAWNYKIGNYQVLRKWLRDRKNQPLSDNEIIHYQRIITSIEHSIIVQRQLEEFISRE